MLQLIPWGPGAHLASRVTSLFHDFTSEKRKQLEEIEFFFW